MAGIHNWFLPVCIARNDSELEKKRRGKGRREGKRTEERTREEETREEETREDETRGEETREEETREEETAEEATDEATPLDRPFVGAPPRPASQCAERMVCLPFCRSPGCRHIGRLWR